MDVTLDKEESAAIQAALRSYCSDLRMEIVDTDNPEYRRTLKAEREVLERALAKLDGAAQGSPLRDDEGAVMIRLVSVWTTD